MDRPEDAASPQDHLRHDLLTAATVLRGTTQLLQRQLARQDGMAAAERALMQTRLTVLATTTDWIVQLARDLDTPGRQPEGDGSRRRRAALSFWSEPGNEASGERSG